jgi:hypothetical protein
MDGFTVYYALFGGPIVLVPSLLDRVLKDRLPMWGRVVSGLLAAALVGLVFCVAKRYFEISP